MSSEGEDFVEGGRALSPVVISAISANFVVFIFSRLFQLTFLAVMARQLSPKEFGIAAAATLFISFVQFSAQFGIGAALVQASSVDARTLRVANTFSIASAAVFALAAAVGAPLAGRWFANPEVVGPARLIALAVLAQGFTVVPQSRLSRQLRARDMSLIELASNIIGSAGIAIPLAIAGAGYWSLAIGTAVQATAKAILLVTIMRMDMRPLVDLSIIRRLFRRGVGFYLLLCIGRLSSEIDRLIVGRYLGATDLGFYGRASAVAAFPGSIYNVVVDRVTLPAFAKVQEQRNRLQGAYFNGLSLIAVIGLPVTACLIALGPDLIRVLLGRGWERAIPIFELLSLSMYFRLSVLVSSTLIRSVGRPLLLAAIQLGVTVSTGVVAMIAWPFGIAAVAGAVAAVALGEYMVTTTMGCRQAGLGFMAFLTSQAHGACGALACAIVLWPLLTMEGAVHLAPALRLVIAGGLMSILGIAAVLISPRLFLGPAGQAAVGHLLAAIQPLLAMLRRRLRRD